MVARQAHNLEVDVFKSILRNHENNRPLWVFFRCCEVDSRPQVMNLLIKEKTNKLVFIEFHFFEILLDNSVESLI